MRATAAAGKLLAKLPLAKLARAKAAKAVDGFEDDEKLRNMSLDAYFTWFWDSTKSDYIRDRIDAEKPLSNYYILSQSRSIAKHAASYQSFKSTTVQDANRFLVEQWMHHLKREGMSANVIVDAMNAVRTPLSWAGKRGLFDEPFSLAGIVRPKERYRKRGILSRTEVAKIVALPTVEVVVPRPRLKNKEKNTSPAPTDLRMKAMLLDPPAKPMPSDTTRSDGIGPFLPQARPG